MLCTLLCWECLPRVSFIDWFIFYFLFFIFLRWRFKMCWFIVAFVLNRWRDCRQTFRCSNQLSKHIVHGESCWRDWISTLFNNLRAADNGLECAISERCAFIEKRNNEQRLPCWPSGRITTAGIRDTCFSLAAQKLSGVPRSLKFIASATTQFNGDLYCCSCPINGLTWVEKTAREYWNQTSEVMFPLSADHISRRENHRITYQDC